MKTSGESQLESNHNIRIHNVGGNEQIITYTKKGYGEITTDRPLGAVRLELALDDAGISQTELAEKIDVNQPTISRIISGKTKRSHYLTDIASILNKNVTWLAGLDQEEKSTVDIDGSELRINDKLFALVHEYHDNDEQGSINTSNNIVVLSTKNLSESLKISNLRSIQQQDRAMSPEIKINSTVIFDTSNKKIINGDIYVIKVTNNIFIRFLFTQPNGQILIRSKDSDFPDFSINPEENSFDVLGKVYSTINTYQ